MVNAINLLIKHFRHSSTRLGSTCVMFLSYQIAIRSIEHSGNKTITNSKTRLDLECSSPAFNKHTIHKNFTQKGQNRHGKCCESLAFFQRSKFVKAIPEHSRSALVFKQPRLRNYFIFGMLYQHFHRTFQRTAISIFIEHFRHSSARLGWTWLVFYSYLLTCNRLFQKISTHTHGRH